MLSLIGLSLLYFLPVIESFDRTWGMNILFAGSLLFSMSCILKGRFRLNGIGIIFLLLLIYFLGIIPFSWSIGSSYIEFLRYLSYFLVFITVINYEDKVQLFKNYIVPVVIINTLILSFLYWLYSFSGLHLAPPENGTNLFYPTFRHNRISDILTIAIPLCLYMVSLVSNRFKKLILLLFLLIFIFLLYFSVGLGAILSLSFAFIIYVLITDKLKENRLLKLIAILLGFITSVIVIVSFLYSQSGNRNHTNFDFLNSLYKPLQTELRLDFLKQAFEGFKISPIMGTGLDTFRYISTKYQNKPAGWSFYAHNHYMELFTETGIIGGILFLILILFILRKSYQATKVSQNHVESLQNEYIFIILFALSLLSLVDYSFHYLSIFLYFFMCVGIIFPSTDVKSVTINKYIILIIVFSIYAIYFINNFDSYSNLIQADKYIELGNKDEAIKILSQAYIWDKKNYGIAKRLGLLYVDLDNEFVHKWLGYAISLDPLDSPDIIKKDYDLYIEEIQIKLEQKDLRQALILMDATKSRYPFYLDSKIINECINKVDLKSKNKTKEITSCLKEYMKKERKMKEYRMLTIQEIQMIQYNENGG